MTHIKILSALVACLGLVQAADACTGITLKSKDDATIVARTIDWSGTEMNNIYTVVPRGHAAQSLLPDGTMNGLSYTSLYGYVGIAVEQPEFVVDGTNEAGLSAALFYFPNYGEYKPYNPADRDISLADFQVVSWILSRFSTIDQVKAAINDVRIINIDPSASTVHWRITEPSGRQVVMELVNGVPNCYDNEIGVLNNFDVPLGVQFAVGRAPNNMPSATQWTVATDLKNMTIYYHTMYNRTIRSIDMKSIDFATVPFQYHALDTDKRQTIVPVQID